MSFNGTVQRTTLRVVANVKLSEQQKEMFKSKLREEIVRRELIK